MADIIKYNSRITLKYDSITEWNKVKDTFIPLKGEVCIINPASDDLPSATCLIKIGDGTSEFSKLDYLSALAADVHDWAKRDAAEFLDWATDKKGEDGTSIYPNSPKLATQDEIAALDSRISGLETWRADLKKVDDVDASGTAEVAVTSVTQADGKITVTKKELPTVAKVGTTTTGSLEFIDSIKQDKGKITATKREISKATDKAYGVVQIGVEVPALSTFTEHEADYSAFKTAIEKYRNADGEWLDKSEGNSIIDTYATKAELEKDIEGVRKDIDNISNIMNFRGVITPSEGQNDPNKDSTAINAFIAADNNTPFSNGDVIVYGGREYVYVVNGDNKTFEEFGDVSRIASLESTVAGIHSYATVTGNSGKAEATTANETLAIEGDNTWIATKAENDKITISHKDVTRATTGITTTDAPAHGGTFTAVKSVDSDAKGHVTKVVTTTVTLPNVEGINSDITDLQNRKAFSKVNTCEAETAQDTLTIEEGTAITVTDDAANDTITIAHADVTRTDPAKLTPAQLAHGGKIQVVTDVDSNDQGHVTAVQLTEFTLPSVSGVESDVTDLKDHVWRSETTKVVTQSTNGATSTTSLESLQATDLTIATKSIGYIIWDCGSATENI